jgi:Ca2+-binding RTX toxin-like protein
VITGTNRADTITMNEGGFDYANGRDGNDRITKRDGGHTMILGGLGADTILLTSTNGYLNGWIHGEGGNDDIQVFPATEGGDYHADIFGGSGNDNLLVDAIEALVHGGSGSDVIEVRGGSYIVDGAGGADTIRVRGEGSATVYGSSGDDTFTSGQESSAVFFGGTGADDFLCGAGDDTVMDYNEAEGDTVSDECEEVNTA